MRIIDANPVLENFDNIISQYRWLSRINPTAKTIVEIMQAARNRVYDQPTIGTEILRPQGEWVYDLSSGHRLIKCSNCGEIAGIGNEDALREVKQFQHFCFNCGAKMKGGENNA